MPLVYLVSEICDSKEGDVGDLCPVLSVLSGCFSKGPRPRHFAAVDAMLAGLMGDERPLADAEYENFALSMFQLELSAEEFAAREGHKFALFNFDNYRYRTPGMTQWVDNLAAYFFSPDLPSRLRAAREKYLSPKEIAEVEAFEQDPY